jgi:hypothetical protein
MFSRGYSYRRYRNARSNGTYSSRRSSIRSRSTGNTRAARAQRDSATVVINRIAPFNVYIYGDYYGESLGGTTFGAIAISHWDELRKSQFFPNYSSMYDQMRLDKTRIKITGSQAVANDNPYSSPSIILAFDRNGLNSTQYVKLPNPQVPSGKTPVAFPDPNIVSTYSSAQTRQWSSGNSFSMYQTVYPSTIQEKGQYIATGALLAPIDPSTITGNIPDSEYANPCSFWQHQSYPFKPVTLLAVRLPTPVITQNTYIFNIEFEFTVTFRGMRKPGIAASSKSLQNDLLLTPYSETIVSNGTVHVTPDEVSSSAKGFSSIDINVEVPQEAAPDPDIQPHTITLTDLNFPKTFEIDAEEPDAPDGWNPITIKYTGPPPQSCNIGSHAITLSDLNFPKTFNLDHTSPDSLDGWNSIVLNYTPPSFPIPIRSFNATFISSGNILSTPISVSKFTSVSTISNIGEGYLASIGVQPGSSLVLITAYFKQDGSIFCYSFDTVHNDGSQNIYFRLSTNSAYPVRYAKQVYTYTTDFIGSNVLFSLMVSISGTSVPVGSVLSQEATSSVDQFAFTSAEAIIPASYYKFDLEFEPLDIQ